MNNGNSRFIFILDLMIMYAAFFGTYYHYNVRNVLLFKPHHHYFRTGSKHSMKSITTSAEKKVRSIPVSVNIFFIGFISILADR